MGLDDRCQLTSRGKEVWGAIHFLNEGIGREIEPKGQHLRGGGHRSEHLIAPGVHHVLPLGEASRVHSGSVQ